MKKHFFLFLSTFFFLTTLFAQSTSKYLEVEGEASSIKGKVGKNKAPGDTLYYEDFDSTGRSANNHLPNGWTTYDNYGMGHVWVWSDQAPGGQYTTAGNLNSNTAINGYLSLPADFYNTPTPSTGLFYDMDAGIQSSAISISPSDAIIIEFQQFYNFLQPPNTNLALEVSTDGINWTKVYDAINTCNGCTVSPNGELVSVNASSVLANQSTVYVRFIMSNTTHYFWMIDDLTILEGLTNAYETNEVSVQMEDTFTSRPQHTQYPFFMMDSLYASAVVENIGVYDQSGFEVSCEVVRDSTLSGVPSSNLAFRDTIKYNGYFVASQLDTAVFDQPKFLPTATGHYRFEVDVYSDSVNQVAAQSSHSTNFVVTDSVMARDNGVFVGSTGPDKYIGGGNDGDRWGALYTLYSQGGTITSVSVYVANDASVVGSAIAPRVWEYDQNAPNLAASISSRLQGQSSTVITSSMLGSWLTLPFSASAANAVLQGGKQYIVGWEQTAGSTNGNNFLAGRDPSMEEPLSSSASIFTYLNDATPIWAGVYQVAGVRANFGNAVVGLDVQHEKADFELYPNPNQGHFNLSVEDVTAFQTLELRNLNGQLIRSEVLKGKSKQHFDLGNLDSGIYFVSLVGEEHRKTQKLIIY